MKKSVFTPLILISFLDYLGLGIVFTVFSPLFLHTTGHILTVTDSHQIRLIWLGAALAVYPLGQFFGAAVWGQLSDYHGRKKILLITLLGTAVGYLLCAIAINFDTLWLLLLARLFTGLCAGNIAVSQSSMADVSTPETKTAHFSLLWIGIACGWISGPFLGGRIAAWYSSAAPFWAVLGITLLIFLYTWIFFIASSYRV